jgi:hypothetical protein
VSRRSAFGLWVLAGAAWALTVAGVLSIGIYVLPFAVLATVVGVRRAPRQWSGALVGVGLLVAWLAWLNRYGPGDHCWSTATESGCAQMWNTWPFAALACALVVVGLWLGRRPPRVS